MLLLLSQHFPNHFAVKSSMCLATSIVIFFLTQRERERESDTESLPDTKFTINKRKIDGVCVSVSVSVFMRKEKQLFVQSMFGFDVVFFPFVIHSF